MLYPSHRAQPSHNQHVYFRDQNSTFFGESTRIFCLNSGRVVKDSQKSKVMIALETKSSCPPFLFSTCDVLSLKDKCHNSLKHALKRLTFHQFQMYRNSGNFPSIPFIFEWANSKWQSIFIPTKTPLRTFTSFPPVRVSEVCLREKTPRRFEARSLLLERHIFFQLRPWVWRSGRGCKNSWSWRAAWVGTMKFLRKVSCVSFFSTFFEGLRLPKVGCFLVEHFFGG